MRERIKQDITRLHSEIEASDLDSNTRQYLDALVDDIEGQIKQEEVEHQDLLEQLEEAVERFEVEHPTLTSVLNNILQSLSNIGI